MKVVVLGCDGFIGFALVQALLAAGHHVAGVDNLSRRWAVPSVLPIESFDERLRRLEERWPGQVFNWSIEEVVRLGRGSTFDVADWQPDVVIHLGELPSAPDSMSSVERACEYVQYNVEATMNLLWHLRSCPNVHLIKLGTMGEYGTPDHMIWEDEEEVSINTHTWTHVGKTMMRMPTCPGSVYHATKVMDSVAVDFACRTWGLRATDVMQGVVYGMADVPFRTRLDVDAVWGTVVHRLFAQAACQKPLTVYGKGEQKRGFIYQGDVLKCLQIVMKHPPTAGSRRIINQIGHIYSINDIAELAIIAANEAGQRVVVDHVPNPRAEKDDHLYSVEAHWLADRGYRPRSLENTAEELYKLFSECPRDALEARLRTKSPVWR